MQLPEKEERTNLKQEIEDMNAEIGELDFEFEELELELEDLSSLLDQSDMPDLALPEKTASKKSMDIDFSKVKLKGDVGEKFDKLSNDISMQT